MIRAVIFDIDNTLYSYDNCHIVAWDALCRYAQQNLGMSREQFTRSHTAAAETVAQRLGAPCAALHDRLLRYQVLLEENGLALGHALPMSERYWDTLIAAATPAPGIMQCLSALKQAGYILGIGTDMTIDVQLKKLNALKMLQFFDFIVSSEEVLAEKPSQKLFQCCAHKAGVPAEQCLFVGDHLKKDIQGAENAGMTPVWYCPDEDQARAHPEYTHITHYDQLLQMVLN